MKKDNVKDKIGISLRKIFGPRKHKLILLGVLLVLAGIAVVTYAMREEKICIGEICITERDIDEYTKSVARARREDPSLVIQGTDREEAVNDLVLDAALKKEAKKHNISVADEDIAKFLEREFNSKSAQKNYLDKHYRSDARTWVRLQAQVYKQKLEDKLISKKDLTMVNVMIDTPYFFSISENKAREEYDKAINRLKTEIVPLMKKGASKEELAKKADTAWYLNKDDGNQDLFLYMSAPAMAVDTLENYQKGVTYFNDIEETSYIRAETLKPLTTNDKIDNLKNVGDYTDVFLSKSGAFMVIRLDKKTGGAYDSWNDLLSSYKKRYADGKLGIVASAIKSNILGAAGFVGKTITSVGLEKARAQIADDICGRHYARFTVVAYNVTSGNMVTDAIISAERKASDRVSKDGEQVGPADTCGNVGKALAISDTGTSATPGNWNRVGGDGNNNDRTIHDSCWNTPPTWKVEQHPPGWDGSNWDGVGTDKRPKNAAGTNSNVFKLGDRDPYTHQRALETTNDGWPTWNSANINASEYWIVLKYESRYTAGPPDIPGEIDAEPNCSVYSHALGANSIYRFTGFYQKQDFVASSPPERETASSMADPNFRWKTFTHVPVYASYNITNSDDQPIGFSFHWPSPEGQMERRVYIERWTHLADGSWRYSAGGTDDLTCEVWSLTVASSASAGYFEAGTDVTFTHTVTNHGNVTASNIYHWATYDYDPSSKQSANPPLSGTSATGNFVVGATGIANPLNTLRGPSEVGFFGKTYCQSYSVGSSNSWGGGVASSPVAGCATLVGGKAKVSTRVKSGHSIYLEPGQRSDMEVILGDTDFNAGGTSWGGYTVSCTYTVTRYAPPPANTSSELATGSCGKTFTEEDPADITATYAYTASSNYGDRVCLTATISATNPALIGKAASTEETCLNVVARPYLKVFGSDIFAGGGVGACVNNASIISWNKGSNHGYQGAGAQFAALARGTIFGFTTAQGSPGSAGYAVPPFGLSFTNNHNSSNGITPGATNNVYGGKFDGSTCGDKGYYTNVPSRPNWSVAAPDFSPDPEGKPKEFKHSGDLTLNTTTLTLPHRSNTIIYVDGNVSIQGNILAQDGAAHLADAPLLTVIARGNIFIHHSVSQLYGTFIATERSPGNAGHIHTCANGFTALNPMNAGNPNSAYTTCRTQLTVTGSFIARKLNLHRTYGSQFEGGSDTPDSSKAAEVFQYNPLIWMRQTVVPNDNSDFRLEAVTSLPPVL